MKQRERDEGMRRQGVDSKREKMNIESRIKGGALRKKRLKLRW